MTSFCRACVDYLHAGGIETIVVVLGHNADQVRARLKEASVCFAVNPDPSSEMAESIRCGLEALPSNTDATLIALVDHPAVPSNVVNTLIDEWRQGAQLIIPTWQDRGGHPVLVDLGWRDELKQLDPNGGLKSFFQRHSYAVRRVPGGSQYVARDMATELDAARLLVYRAAYLRDTGAANVKRAASEAKLFATEAASRIIDSAVQIHGATGLVRGSIVERLYREIRALRIYEGTSEIQKLIIASQLTKE